MKDLFWGAVAVLFALLAVATLGAGLWLLVVERRFSLRPLTLLLCWWLGMGAWRRTRWSRPATRQPLP